MSPTMKIILSIVLTTAVVGGGTYYVVNSQAETDKAALQSSIDSLSQKVAELEKPTSATSTPSTTSTASPSATSETTSCTEATSSQKAYTSTNYGFCFTYPSKWTLTDGAGTGGSSWRVSVTDKVLPDTDYPGQVHVDSYKTVKALDSKNIGATSLKNYLDKYAALDDPVYKNVKAATIGGKDGYVAEAGPNQFGGGKYYFVSLGDGSIIKIWLFTESSDTNSVLSSFKFTK